MLKKIICEHGCVRGVAEQMISALTGKTYASLELQVFGQQSGKVR